MVNAIISSRKAFLLMAIKTIAEQLEEVQTAISLVMSGQSATLDGKSLTYASLSALTDREQMLLKRYNSETLGRGLAINAGVKRRDY